MYPYKQSGSYWSCEVVAGNDDDDDGPSSVVPTAPFPGRPPNSSIPQSFRTHMIDLKRKSYFNKSEYFP